MGSARRRAYQRLRVEAAPRRGPGVSLTRAAG